MRRIALSFALLAAVSLVAVTGAGAAMSPSYQVSGFGFGAQQTSFFGTGLGSAGDRGMFQASVAHDAWTSCATVGSSCAVTGGTFSVRTAQGQESATFGGGSFQLASAAPGCGAQSFAVNATLAGAAGPLVFTGTMSTFRFQFRGQCQTLFSTLQGSLAPAPAPPTDQPPADPGL